MLSDIGLGVSAIGFLVAQFSAVRDAVRGRTTVTLLASVPTALFLGNTTFWLFYLDQTFAGVCTMFSIVSWTFLAYSRATQP